jgi:hypothetical protein
VGIAGKMTMTVKYVSFWNEAVLIFLKVLLGDVEKRMKPK